MVVSGCLVPKRPRQSLESDVAAPIPEVNISTVAGSSVGSSTTGAGVDTAVSCTPVEVRSTTGPPAMVIIAGTSDSVPVSVEARYAEVVLDAGPSEGSSAAVSCAPVKVRSTGYVPSARSCTDVASDAAAPIPEVNISTVAGSSVGSSAPVGPNLAAPISEVNISTVVGSSVGSSAADPGSSIAAPIPEVNISTVAGSSVGSSALVLGPPGLLESGTDLVEVGLVMRDLLCSVFQLAQEHQFALLSSW